MVGEPWHGTIGGYTNHRCRCAPCSDARRLYRAEWYRKNHSAVIAGQHKYYSQNRSACDFRRRAWKFGITTTRLAELLSPGRCEICGTTDPGNRDWCIDHDHSCCPTKGRSCGLCIRGLLCQRCNTAIAFFDDDTDRLEAAIRYLRESNE